MENESKKDERLDDLNESPLLEAMFAKLELDELYADSEFYNTTYAPIISDYLKNANDNAIKFSKTLEIGFVNKSLEWVLRAEKIITLAKEKMPIISVLEEKVKTINEQLRDELENFEAELVGCMKETLEKPENGDHPSGEPSRD